MHAAEWSTSVPDGPRRGSSSNPSENNEHAPAQLKQQRFGVLSGLKPQAGISSIWALHANGDLQSWASEMDVQQLVKAVLQDAITASGLGPLLKCYNELSIFKLRPDIWVVMNERGVPVGVCEVKKPGRTIMESTVVHGQIYDYMLRLRSFHGIKHVFGIVSTYEQWRLYWLEDCAPAAAATALPVAAPSVDSQPSSAASPATAADAAAPAASAGLTPPSPVATHDGGSDEVVPSNAELTSPRSDIIQPVCTCDAAAIWGSDSRFP
jgi:hypothetical protein